MNKLLSYLKHLPRVAWMAIALIAVAATTTGLLTVSRGNDCDRLPNSEGVLTAMSANQATIDKMLQVAPVNVGVDTKTCPQKAQIMVQYDKGANTKELKKVFNDSPLATIPVKWLQIEPQQTSQEKPY